jgi:TP901 family phage tail tape measure protein
VGDGKPDEKANACRQERLTMPPTLELETLRVKFVADADKYLKESAKVRADFAETELVVKDGLGKVTKSLGERFERIAGAMTAIKAAAGDVGALFDKIGGTLPQGLAGIESNIANKVGATIKGATEGATMSAMERITAARLAMDKLDPKASLKGKASEIMSAAIPKESVQVPAGIVAPAINIPNLAETAGAASLATVETTNLAGAEMRVAGAALGASASAEKLATSLTEVFISASAASVELAAVDRLTTELFISASAAASSVGELAGATSLMAGAATLLAEQGQVLGSIGGVGPQLTAFAGGMTNVVTVMNSVPNIEASLKSIATMQTTLTQFGESLPGLKDNLANLSTISGTITRFSSRIKAWDDSIAALTTGIGRRITNFSAKIPEWATAFDGLSGMSGPLEQLAASLLSVQNVTGITRDLTDFAHALPGISLAGLSTIGDDLRKFGSKLDTEGFRTLTASTGPLSALSTVGADLSLFSTFLAGMDFTGLETVGTQLHQFGAKTTTKGMEALFASEAKFASLGKIGTHLLNFGVGALSVDVSSLPALTGGLDQFAKSMGAIDLSALTGMSSSFASLGQIGQHLLTFGAGLAQVNTSGLVTVGGDLNKFARSVSTNTFQNLLQNPQQFSALVGIGRYFAQFSTQISIAQAGLANLSTMGTGLTDFAKAVQSSAFQKMLTNPQQFANLNVVAGYMKTLSTTLSSTNIANLNALTAALNALGGAGGGKPPRLPPLPTPGGMGSGMGGIVRSGSLAALSDESRSFAFELQSLRFGIIGIGAVSVIAFARYDDALTRSLAMTRGATYQMRQQWDETIRSIIASGKGLAGPTELAGGFQALIQQGFSPEMARQNLALISQFAAVAGKDVAHVSEQFGVIRHSFGLAVGDLERIANVTTRAAQLGGGGLDNLMAGLVRIGPVAHTLNLSLEDTSAALAALHYHGIAGAEAGTQLMRVLSAIEAHAIDPRHMEKYSRLGIEPFQNGRFVGLANFIDMLKGRLEGMSDAGKRIVLSDLGLASGGQGMGIMRVLGALTDGSGNLRSFQNELRNTGGVFRVVADEVMSSFGHQMIQLWNNLKMVAIDLGGMLAPALGMVRIALSGIVSLFGMIPSSAKFAVAAFLAMAVGAFAFSSSVLGIRQFVLFIASNGGVMAMIGTDLKALFAFLGLSLPMGWIFVAVAALAGLALATEEGRRSFGSMGGSLTAIGNVLAKVGAGLISLSVPLLRIIEALSTPVFTILAAGLEATAGVLGFVMGIFESLPEPIQAVVYWITGATIALRLFGVHITLMGACRVYLGLMRAGVSLLSFEFRGLAVSIWAAVVPMLVFVAKVLLVVAAIAGVVDIISRLLGFGSPVRAIADAMGLQNLDLNAKVGGALRGGPAPFVPSQVAFGGGAALQTAPNQFQTSVVRHHAGFLGEMFPNFLGAAEGMFPNFLGTTTMGSATRNAGGPALGPQQQPLGFGRQIDTERFVSVPGEGLISALGTAGNPMHVQDLRMIQLLERQNPPAVTN